MPTSVAEPAEKPVGERDQRDERQHHRADRDRELHAGLRALRCGHDDVGGLHAFFERLRDVDLRVLDRIAVRRVVGHDHLGHEDAARRGHEGGGEQIRQIARAEQAGVGSEDRARRRRPCRRTSR